MPIPSTSKTSTKTVRRRALALAAALALFFFAVPAGATSTGDSLTLGIISVITTKMNPFMPVEREFMSLTALIYEGLLQIDDDYLPQPCLAERWDVSAGGGTWYFYIREGVTFHDGTPMTANDVVASANEILRLAQDETAANKGYYASLKYFIKSISASDNLTVVVKTDRANYSLLYAMTFPVLPAAQVQADNPPGTGPYTAETFAPADYLLLTANKSWWRTPPAVQEIMTIFHSANRDLISNYEYNNIDTAITRAITAAQYRSGVTSLNINYRTRQLETLLMNNRVPELEDINVRKAIRYAINVDTLASSAYLGMVTRTDTPMISGTWMYHGDDSAFVYDPDKSRALLDAAGWTDTDADGIRDAVVDGKKANLVLRLFVYEEQEDSVRVQAANLIADMLEQVGIKANITTMTYTQTKEKLAAGSFDLCLATYNTDTVPDPGFLLLSGNTGNYSRYKSDAMDQLCQTLRKCVTRDEYAAKLAEIQTQFTADCPFICLYYRNGALLTRKMFTSVRDVREPELLRGIESTGT
jgi:peptide/nickel transport system substrate-binding protein